MTPRRGGGWIATVFFVFVVLAWFWSVWAIMGVSDALA
jgi:hypothetical protein